VVAVTAGDRLGMALSVVAEVARDEVVDGRGSIDVTGARTDDEAGLAVLGRVVDIVD
jgi:hypothetical protein